MLAAVLLAGLLFSLVPSSTAGLSASTSNIIRVISSWLRPGNSSGFVPCSTDKPTKNLNIQYKTVAGTDKNLLSLDIYAPKGCVTSAPVMVYVHGGGWQSGDKSQNLGDKVKYFNDQGFVFVSVNYRLAPDAMYPAFNEDVADALAWLAQNASKYGGDAKKLSLIGHSAGGSIVSSVATDESYMKDSRIPRTSLRCTIALDSTAYDIGEAAEAWSERVDGKERREESAIYENAFGTDPAVYEDASPISHVEEGKYAPLFFLVTRGDSERISLVEEFANALKETGKPAPVIDAGKLSHEEVNDAIGKKSDKVITPKLTAFISRCK